jgi:hypothetical protein
MFSRRLKVRFGANCPLRPDEKLTFLAFDATFRSADLGGDGADGKAALAACA